MVTAEVVWKTYVKLAKWRLPSKVRVFSVMSVHVGTDVVVNVPVVYFLRCAIFLIRLVKISSDPGCMS